MTTQNTIQVIDTAKVQVLIPGTLQTEQGSVEHDNHPINSRVYDSRISIQHLSTNTKRSP